MSDELFVKLRDCFTAGYTLPQYCVDNGIKSPLFVSEEKYELFVWQVYVQFRYDKRLKARFGFFNTSKKSFDYSFAHEVWELKLENLSEASLDPYDKIIVLSNDKTKLKSPKTIYLDALEKYFLNKVYCEIPLLHFLQRYPKVKLIVTNFPSIRRYKGGLEFHNKLPTYVDMMKLLSSGDNATVETTLDRFGYKKEEQQELVGIPRIKTNPDGTTYMEATAKNSLRRIQGSGRATAYQPEHYVNKIYFFGSCHQFGMNAPFDKTIESYLQLMLNEADLPYRVENEGQYYFGRRQDVFYNLNALKTAPGDIIFIWFHNWATDALPLFDFNDVFDPPHDYREIFCTQHHVNERGYKLVAEKFFNYLTENNFFRDKQFTYPLPPPPNHRYGIPPQFEASGLVSGNAELNVFKQSLRAKRVPIGAIVMNCNPFTLGHQYLVEYAASQVVRLYVFVVEEDRSEFPFADRLELVKQGVKHIPNVEVLPSGKFILDSSEDVEIFGREIAPTLGITIRFAGEEPTDNVTRQYNETMRAVLPRYGVEFREIPRKALGDEVISASTVRRALRRNDFDKIKALVPAATFDYLREHQDEFQRRYRTARIDVKLMAEGDFQILNLSDDKATVDKPAWFQKGGTGYQIQSCGDKLTFVAKTEVAGQIQLWLRGKWVPNPSDKSKLIPYWIDYTRLVINGEVVFDTVTPAWHDKPYVYNTNVQAGEEVTVTLEWLPHDS